MTVVAKIPVLGFAAYSGTGKTTLLEQIIPRLRQRAIRVALIKHAHHDFDIDQSGKDSYRLRKAGAGEVLVASRKRWALIHENAEPFDDEPRLAQLIGHLDHDNLDLILVEGFKHEHFPRIELHRPKLGHPLMCVSDGNIIALATDAMTIPETTIPVLDLNDVEAVTSFVVTYLRSFAR